jgi:ABC-type nickel/cobalt efflux system permease component RcnA
VLALRDLGTARTGAYFSTAPFIGVVLSLLLFHEVPQLLFWPALMLMLIGVWMHLTEHHEHDHLHEALEHEHAHRHDEPHVPDLHHRHDHPVR